MRASDLRRKLVRDTEGRRVGRVHEAHVKGGVLVSFVCGPGGLLQRLAASRKGRRYAWEAVQAVTDDAIIVAVDGARHRTAAGTRRAEGR